MTNPDWSGGKESLSDKSEIISRDELEGLTSSQRAGNTTELAEAQNVEISREAKELLQ